MYCNKGNVRLTSGEQTIHYGRQCKILLSIEKIEYCAAFATFVAKL